MDRNLHLVVDLSESDRSRLDQIHILLRQLLAGLHEQRHIMSALSDAVDALAVRVSEDTQHLLDLLAEANARAEAAAANDAADAATIADLQAQNAAAQADAEATVARLNSIDPVADFPGVEPPPEG